MLRLVPNAITVIRGLCGPVVVLLVVHYGSHFVAFWVFVAAMVTDLLDGWVARRLGAISALAEILDPVADKLLTDLAWVGLAWVGFAPAWLAIGMLARDAIVIGAWLVWALPRGLRWSPRPMGQISVAFEGVSLAVLLFHGPWLDVHWPTVGAVLGAIGLALSIGQLLEYAVGPRRAASPAP
jgi:CDP-diacylglycerol--glycerol-3-phosphate 3-phosphatidyltransferase